MLLAFHKPFGVLSQFSKEHPSHRTLAEFGFPKNVYPIGRLDADSEGLLLLSDEASWNDRLLHPRHAHERTYHAQVEKVMTEEALASLRKGVKLPDFQTLPCKAELLAEQPAHGPRIPPIRERKSIPTSWVALTLIEGKNRQVRRMTAAVGFPTLRLIRVSIGGLKLEALRLGPGEWKELGKPELDRIF
ncbi:pseudouridine synthase [Phragmitibacter flavus]|uniref:Pseudouridine synthase n=1 Tax=Phragmitibacter flavus TaxID=2576071 RepID=A0A5R8KHA5_9BACT|nr:pseudouridine synthase [Phragmitibacter flavus]